MNKPLHPVFLQIVRASWVGFIVIAAFAAVYFFVPVVYPFLIGWLVAYILNPLANLLQRKAKFPRWLASTVSLLAFLGVISIVITMIVNKIIFEIGRLVSLIENNIQSWINKFIELAQSDRIQEFLQQLSTFYNQNEQVTQTIDTNLQNAGKKLADAISGLVNAAFDGLISFITKLPNFTLMLIIAILAAFFISKDWYVWQKRLTLIFPKRINESFGKVWIDLKRALFGFVRAQLIMISITALFVCIGLLILGVDYAITIGLLIGLVDLLPYLGVGAAMVPWIIYVFIQGNIGLGIGLSILYGIVFVTRSAVEPKVLAFSIGMDALSTLIAMVIGLYFFGALGIIIGPVSLVILITMHRANVFRQLKAYIRGS